MPGRSTDEDVRFGEQDLHLFNEGTHYRVYRKLGAHLARTGSEEGVRFGLWAPNAERVSVVGDFNGWEEGRHPLAAIGASGIWEGFLSRPGAGRRLQVPAEVPSRRLHRRQDRSLRLPPRDRSQDRVDRVGSRLRIGATATGCAIARPGTPSTPPSPSTRSTWARGAGPPTTPRRSWAIATWLRSSPTTRPRWASPTSSSCR